MVVANRLSFGAARVLAHIKHLSALTRMFASQSKTGETCAAMQKKKDSGAVLRRHKPLSHGHHKSRSHGHHKALADGHPKSRKPETIKQTFPFYHLIKFKKECCEDSCATRDIVPFDKCHYKESDKNARKYQVTWTECPALAIRPKKVCCFDQIKKPPVQRRKSLDRPQTACKQVRESFKCTDERRPSVCAKVKAPYPSFSECTRPKLSKKRKSECTCFATPPSCDVFKVLKKRELRRNVTKKPSDA